MFLVLQIRELYAKLYLAQMKFRKTDGSVIGSYSRFSIEKTELKILIEFIYTIRQKGFWKIQKLFL